MNNSHESCNPQSVFGAPEHECPHSWQDDSGPSHRKPFLSVVQGRTTSQIDPLAPAERPVRRPPPLCENSLLISSNL